MTPKDIPDVISAHIMTNNNGSFLHRRLAGATLTTRPKLWAQTMLQFTNAINRKESGAAITDEEWRTARQLYIPTPNDKAPELKRKYMRPGVQKYPGHRQRRLQKRPGRRLINSPRSGRARARDWTAKAPVGGWLRAQAQRRKPARAQRLRPEGVEPSGARKSSSTYLDAK